MRILSVFIMLAGLVSLPNQAFSEEHLRGLVKPLHSIELSMPVDGVIADLVAKEGQKIQKGAVIIKLDDRLQALEVERKKSIWQDKTALQMLKNNQQQMEDIAQRKEALFTKTRSVSQSDLNRTQIQLNTARGEYENARQNEHQQQLDYKIAAQVLAYYTLKAPVDGELIEIKPSIGEWVNVGDVVATLVDISVCILELDIDVKAAQGLRDQQEVTVNVHLPDGDLEKQGRVVFVSSVADEGSTLVRTKIQFDNRDGRVVPGVTASLVLAKEIL